MEEVVVEQRPPSPFAALFGRPAAPVQVRCPGEAACFCPPAACVLQLAAAFCASRVACLLPWCEQLGASSMPAGCTSA